MVNRVCCAFFGIFGSCGHPNMPRSWFFRRGCLELGPYAEFVGTCRKKVHVEYATFPPSPPPRRK